MEEFFWWLIPRILSLSIVMLAVLVVPRKTEIGGSSHGQQR
jgi:hypothetical protein